MPSYKAPGVYVQDIVSGSQSISLASSSVGILIGVAKAGITNTAVKIGSWTEFISNFANGLDTPFMENSYLPYAVHGFFTNGGKELYIGNVKKNANHEGIYEYLTHKYNMKDYPRETLIMVGEKLWDYGYKPSKEWIPPKK